MNSMNAVAQSNNAAVDRLLAGWAWQDEKRKPPRPAPMTGTPSNGHPTNYASAALTKESNRVAAAAVSSRNDTLNRAAFALGTLVGADEIERALVEENLAAAAATCGLPETEAARTIRSGLDAGILHPREHREKNGRAPTPGRTLGFPAPNQPGTAYEIIMRHFLTKYDPTFRRGTVLYSRTLGREVKLSEATAGAGKEVIEDLALASDAPRMQSGAVRRNALPGFFKTWAPSAWVDMLDGLPDEEQSEEIVDPARDEFRGKVMAAMFAMVCLAYYREAGPDSVERRTLIDWARRFAKEGRWESVRGYRLWSRIDKGRVRIALRVELFSQAAGSSDLVRAGQAKFAQLCRLYDVGEAVRVRGGRVRAVELTDEFVECLLAEPIDEGMTDTPIDQSAESGGGVCHRVDVT